MKAKRIHKFVDVVYDFLSLCMILLQQTWAKLNNSMH